MSQKVGRKGAGARRPTLGIPNESLGQIHFKNHRRKGRRPPGRPPEAGEGRRRSKFFFGSNESLGQIHFKNAGGKGRRPPEAGEGRRRSKFFFGSNENFALRRPSP